MPDLERFLQALGLVAFLLYLVPSVERFGIAAPTRLWMQRAALLLIGVAIAIAVVATILWFSGSGLPLRPAGG